MDAAKEQTLADLGKLILRVTSGGMMLTHGIPKAMAFSAKAATFPDPLGIGHGASMAGAVFGEVVCALLIVVGAWTRPAAVPAAFTMAVAAFVVHATDDFGKKEKALLYLLMYLAVACLGAGRWSVDGWLAKKRG